jgi:hypothetical protein
MLRPRNWTAHWRGRWLRTNGGDSGGGMPHRRPEGGQADKSSRASSAGNQGFLVGRKVAVGISVKRGAGIIRVGAVKEAVVKGGGHTAKMVEGLAGSRSIFWSITSGIARWKSWQGSSPGGAFRQSERTLDFSTARRVVSAPNFLATLKFSNGKTLMDHRKFPKTPQNRAGPPFYLRHSIFGRSK